MASAWGLLLSATAASLAAAGSLGAPAPAAAGGGGGGAQELPLPRPLVAAPGCLVSAGARSFDLSNLVGAAQLVSQEQDSHGWTYSACGGGVAPITAGTSRGFLWQLLFSVNPA